MKNRLMTDAVREVRHTLGRFLSLFLLSALSVAFLAGLKTTAPDMERSADSYYDAQRLMDLHILSTLGLTGEDLAALAAQPGIALAEGAYTIDAIAGARDADRIVKALSIGEQVNLPMLLEGRLPQSSGECLVEPKLMEELGLSLGDSITLDTGTGTYEDALLHWAFTVVGTANSPLYISVERGSSSLGAGRVAAFVLLPRDAFQMEAFTDAYLLGEGLDQLLCYGSEYGDRMDALLDRLEPLGGQRASLRYGDIVGTAEDKLSDAQQEFDEAEADTNRELADALQKLKDAREDLDQGWLDYAQGQKDYQKAIAEAEAQISEAETVTLPDALADLNQGELDYTEGVQKWQDGFEEYLDGQETYEDGLQTYNDAYYELVSKGPEYNDGLQKLRDGEKDYAAGAVVYSRGMDQLVDAGKQITEAEAKLQKALDQLFEGQLAYNAGVSQLQDSQAQFQQGESQFYTQVDGAKQLLLGPSGAGVDSDTFLNGLSTPEGVAGAWQQIEANRPYYPPEVQAQLPQSQEQLQGYAEGLLTGRETLNGFRQQLSAGQQQLDSASSQLYWGEAEYQMGRDQVNASKKTFLSAAEEAGTAGLDLKAARDELDQGWSDFYKGKREMEDGWNQLDDARTELVEAENQLDDAWQTLMDGKAELEEARAKLDEGWASYQQGLLDLETAKAALEAARVEGLNTLTDSKRQLEDGEADYQQGLADYEDGKGEADEKLSEARRELNSARRQISEIEHCKWYILDRNTNAGYVAFQQDAQRMGNLASVFPVIFFLVAALVCLTTMTRMVEEQRVQIGGYKALGYGKAAVSVKYVGYGLAASLLGGLSGLALGCTVIPWIIYTAWTILYTLGPLQIPFYPGISLLSVGAAVVTVAGAAFLTCWSTLAEVPAQLMRPKAPQSGKRVFLERIRPLWSRLSFTQKVTVRNLFRYKKRFFMTVVGIGGCTALIVTGFGLRDSIMTIMPKQFDELFPYTSQIGLSDNVTPDERLELERALADSPEITDFMPVQQTALSIESEDRSVEGYLTVLTLPDKVPSFITLRHRVDHSSISLRDDGAVLTEKLASLLGVGVGDDITLSGDERVQVRVAAVTENYIAHYVYLTGAYYEQVYGKPPEDNMLFANYAEDTREVNDAVAARLISLSGVTSVSRVTDTRSTYQHSMESVDYAVVVIIISAAALAFVVLFNLTNINITERMRELATLKVLGFYNPELNAYVYRENILLTFFGVLAGLIMGKFLHQWLVLTVEIDMLMFWRRAEPMSYLYAVLLTAFFSLLVNIAASRKLKKIDMVESLKTVE